MDFKSTIRNLALNNLSASHYRSLALFTNDILARFKEIKIKKPMTQIVKCDYPLIYISQPPRSGGTLLRNLFDGHFQCFVFPHELGWQKNGFDWRDRLEKESARKIYKLLSNRWVPHAIVHGIERRHPFLFNRRLQRKIFFENQKQKNLTTRDWLDKYFTSFFNAWVNYQNLYSIEKRFVVAFCPWVINSLEKQESFFRVYPKGYRVYVVRDPLAWWASEKRYGSKKKNLKDYFKPRWMKSTRKGIELSNKNPERYLLVSFEEIIGKPGKGMRLLAERVGLEFRKDLLHPTVNNMSALSNTSFGEGRKGIDKSVLSKWEKVLNIDEKEEIERETRTIYKKAVAQCINTDSP